MLTGLRRSIAPLLAAIGLAAGCAQPGTLTRRPMMVGTLKTEIARLEQEKEQYRRRAAELETENARIAEDLVKERAFSGDLEARLADARALLDRKGLAAEPSFFDSPPSPPVAEWDHRPPAARTQPAADTERPGRKAPFARIGSPPRPVPNPEDVPDAPTFDLPASPPGRDAAGPQSRVDPPVRWLPIADTASSGGPAQR